MLFVVTFGIGYVAWSLLAWGQGRSPAQRITMRSVGDVFANTVFLYDPDGVL